MCRAAIKTKRAFGFGRFAAFALFIAVCFGSAEPAMASHFRYGHLTWVPRPDLGPNTAEYTLINAFRRSGYGAPVVGTIITETIGATRLFYGDGGDTGILRYEVTAFDAFEDWIIARAIATPGGGVLLHTYAAATSGGLPWVARIDSAARIGSLQNCPGCGYRVETQVRFDIVNSSPVSGLLPIINAPINTVFSFFVPALDGNGDALSWRFSTAAESAISDPIGPDFANPDATFAPTINSSTGQVTWNTTGGTAIGNLFTTSVRIEESRSGSIIGSSTVDFILKIVDAVANDPPICSIDPPGPFKVFAGDPFTFDVNGSDPNAGNTITLNSGGLPPGATMTPGLPLVGPNTGVMSTFDWTPGVANVGPHVVNYSVTDNGGLQALCTASITVNQPRGACCDRAQTGGVCTNDVLPDDCVGSQLVFFQAQDCDEVEARGDCPEHTGACCDHAQPGGSCVSNVPRSQCLSSGGVAVFSDPNEFASYNAAHGKFKKGIEDFEESDAPPGSKSAFPDPLQGGVPSTGFPNGLAELNLIIQANVTPGPSPADPNPSGNPVALFVVGAGFIGSNSKKVGEDLEVLQGQDTSLDLIFTEPNHTGVGFELGHFQGFGGGDWTITVYDKADEIIGIFIVPNAVEPAKNFFGIWTPQTIGRINIYDDGIAPDAVDDIWMWVGEDDSQVEWFKDEDCVEDGGTVDCTEHTGACCDGTTGNCVNNVPASLCPMGGCTGEPIIDADGIASPGHGIPGSVNVTCGAALASFPTVVQDAGLDWFDTDSDGQWTFGLGGDDLHSEDTRTCPGAIRDGFHQLGADCKIIDLDASLFTGQQVNCDLEVNFPFTPPHLANGGCPSTLNNIRYHDANGDGGWDSGEDIVLDANGDGIFGTPGDPDNQNRWEKDTLCVDLDPACTEHTGACCDKRFANPTQRCRDGVPESLCIIDDPNQVSWEKDTLCADLDPPCLEHTGACCDQRFASPALRCRDGIPESQCIIDDPSQVTWTKDTLCANLDPPCLEHTGACCNAAAPGGDCQNNVPDSQCPQETDPQYSWYKDLTCVDLGSDCSEHTGACCDQRFADPALRCRDGIAESLCVIDDPTQVTWTKDTLCADLDPLCTEHIGACCNRALPGGVCQDNVPDSQCPQETDPQYSWYKDEPCTAVEARGDCPEHRGACCDGTTGNCTENVLESSCTGDQQVWYKDTPCADVPEDCPQHRGACCDTNWNKGLGPICRDDVLPQDCVLSGLDKEILEKQPTWYKGLRCDDPAVECEANPIPTVSAWGLAVLALVLLVGGKIYASRRRVLGA